jgi:hypothetical protein
LKFAKSHQIKLDKDPFLMNMNMVELDRKKVLIRPSQVESTKGKDVVIGEERPMRIIKPKSLKGGQWQKNEGASHSNAQRPPSTFSWINTRKAGSASVVSKIRPSRIPNRTVRFPWVRLAYLQLEAQPAKDLGFHRGEFQKVGVIVNKIIIQRLTSRSGHQCLSRDDLRR